MRGGDSNAIQRMYLAGLQAQSSVYGATIPVIYGCARSSMLLNWMHDLREGSSSKKAKKKGSKTYVENADFLIGHNPLAGVLQIFGDGQKVGLLFSKLTTNIVYPAIIGQTSTGTVTITDPDFYFVIGVTANVDYSETFNDYGGRGSQAYSGTYEMPLWNVNYAGPDPANQSGYKNFPAIYQWIPYSGNVIRFPSGAVITIPGVTGYLTATITVNVYYAKLDPAWRIGNKWKGTMRSPLSVLRLLWESRLGSGTEYSTSSAPAQQIIYPPYAGVGSEDLDLGSSGAAPAILPEVMGTFPLYPRGDADYADMIEDIFKSGPAQAGTGAAAAYGDIHHGLGCLDFPGIIQKKYVSGDVFGAHSITFDMPNTAGNKLICVTCGESTGITITDSAGNTWTTLVGGSTKCQVNICTAVAAQSNTITLSSSGGYTQIFILEIAGLDTVDGSAVVTTGTGPTAPSTSIPTTNKPGEDAFVLSMLLYPITGAGLPHVLVDIPHWASIQDRVIDKFNLLRPVIQAYKRSTKFPGTYAITYPAPGAPVPWTSVIIAFKNSQPNTFTSPLGDILDAASLDWCRRQCRAYGLIGSLVMDSQKKAADWLEELYAVMHAAPVWSGDKLKSIPYAETSAVANGAVFVSPTASGPVMDIVEGDFEAGPNEAPVTVERSAQVDAPNLLQIQSPNRDSNYDDIVTSEPDNGSMALYGTRKESPAVFRSIQTAPVARMLLGTMIRVANLVRNKYKFKLQPKFWTLEAMDLVTIPVQSMMPAIDPNQKVAGTIPIRLTSVVIDDDYRVECEAEPFIYGLRTPSALTVASLSPYVPSIGADGGDVNVPVIFEAVPGLAGKTNLGQLYLVISGANVNYGGCIAYISTDGGASYNPLGPNSGVIKGNGTTGVTVGAWAAHADPDTVNDLVVDLTESIGQLASYLVADEDNFIYPCYVAGGGGNPITYEIMTYALANLTSASHYTLKATGGGGNKLRRAVFGAPAGTGVLHAGGSRFAFLDPNNPIANGVLRVPIDPKWVGTTLHFKFISFNKLGGGVQALATATDYTYALTGTAGGVNTAGIPPQTFLINGT